MVVLGAVLVGIIGYQALTPSSFSAANPIDALLGDRQAAHGAAAGVLPDGATVFDDYPAVTNLDPALLAALRQAATDAAHDGVEFYVNSGWRSAAYQERLLDEAVSEYGSKEEAARWVATPETSPHVSGDAVDLGAPTPGSGWPSTGPGTGCARSTATSPGTSSCGPRPSAHGCPPMYADPTSDPRMG